MLVDFSIFKFLIELALIVTGLSPVILLGLLIKDWLKGDIW